MGQTVRLLRLNLRTWDDIHGLGFCFFGEAFEDGLVGIDWIGWVGS